MKRSLILPVIFILGLLFSVSQKSEAIDIHSKYKIVLAGAVAVAALYYFTSEDNRKDCRPIARTFLVSALFGGMR